ncbi:uncharacterized protein LOC123564957 [Mercenaria mercenaria]|uniref:uncharacterized protein LOC123564957 n=1 Tax=Mercenaria mercenaria TaxID=6596 RepID=UPI001E1D828C|nr:uncharacterized protein LOC123564957 [Mercenaria mercenaria]XP_045214822.1 uncharacterized protein LOC123564957 [Mercenaria mercenaria]XP_045214823.1 uncharacterized protein LOC123564957 [Mercenaria mercenaria]XP_045214824.1 uncharacterized protein LOC123564957 [Mercenaria mercenaria]XP_045214826.1 uncharacterized protein LOC123564957 [Mercenaria mercenaria]XP_045214827.1 uncharacterized protein LOC123564957 [Mercenaria mercenaria]XP_045214828.1 uncharacterized protein LOC123564957 [Mercen
MSFEEPKAPIVRIRKKRTKKKSKDNDIVHLPVRASQQGRYSSLTTPPNPQTKGRECCRHIFASCMKIPLCRLICFRCILPKCYSGSGSDDEDANIKDEGYHSQNRRSSEILPTSEGGAQGGTDPQSVEMTEIKSETATLIPPPRTNINEYRRDPCKSEQNGKTNGEVTYIEVESVSLTDSYAALNIPNGDSKSDDTKEFILDTLETGYEEPVHAGVLEFPILKSSGKEDSSEYVDCDNSDDSESRIYVNESVLGIFTDSCEKNGPNIDINYINVGPTGSEQDEMHSKEKVKLGKPHEYVNLPSLESTAITVKDDVNASKSNIPSDEKETGKGDLLEEGKKETDTVLTGVDEKLPSNDAVEVDKDKGNDIKIEDNSDSEKNFVIETGDAEKLLEKKKEKVQEIATDIQDDMEDGTENDQVGDQTKLL